MTGRSIRQLLVIVVVITGGVTLLFTTFVYQTMATVRFSMFEVDEIKVPPLITAPCIDRMATLFHRVEDLFCWNLPPFIPQYKNPCFYDYTSQGHQALRCFPYFYIIGMDKCGTTDLHSRIASHPDVRGNRGLMDKETTFWSWGRYGVWNYRRTKSRHKWSLSQYFNKFVDTSIEIDQRNESSHVITGDATPMDLWDFRYWNLIPQNFGKPQPEILTPHLIRYLYKDRHPKILIQLRDPIERLYSDYIFLKQGENPHTFHAHVLKAISIIKACLERKPLRLCFFDKDIYRRLPTRIHLGCYSVFIKEWLQVFPRSTFHITRTEDFHDDMKGTLNDIFDFLHLEPLQEDIFNSIISQNRKHVTKSKKGKVLPHTYSILYQFYLPCLQETASLLHDKRFLWEDVYSRRLSSLEKEQENQDTTTTSTTKTTTTTTTTTTTKTSISHSNSTRDDNTRSHLLNGNNIDVHNGTSS